jgi:hypothetical protein
MFEEIGLRNITIEDQSEISTPEKDSFFEETVIWKKVAEIRGPQLVRDGYISEEERQRAIKEYEEWMNNEAKYMKLYLLAITGNK